MQTALARLNNDSSLTDAGRASDIALPFNQIQSHLVWNKQHQAIAFT